MIPPNFKQEKRLWQMYRQPLVALDEAGRGSLAGPVTAAALLIKNPLKIRLGELKKLGRISDSKHLSFRQREKIYAWLRNNPQLSFASSSVSAKTIDKVNIRQANFRAMRQAIKKLEKKAKLRQFTVLLDGKDKLAGLKNRQFSFIKGDEKVFSLAMASIVAKVRRDRLLLNLARRYPHYGLEIHKGYGTELHYQLLVKHGNSPLHRKTFLRKLQSNA